MAVAAVVIATGGFMVGGGLGESLAQQREGYSAPRPQASYRRRRAKSSEFFAGDGI